MRFTNARWTHIVAALAAVALLAGCGSREGGAAEADPARAWAVRVCTEADALGLDLLQLREDFEVDSAAPPDATAEQARRIREQAATDVLTTLASLQGRYLAVLEGLEVPPEVAAVQDALLTDGRGALDRTHQALAALEGDATPEALASVVGGMGSGERELLQPPSPELTDTARALFGQAGACGSLAS